MAKTGKASESVKAIKLARELRIATASATFSTLRDAASAAAANVSLDARQVEKADAAGLQALLAGRVELQRAGKSVTWTGCSPQLKSAADLLGLSESLGLPR